MSRDKKAIVPVEQKQVEFYGDELIAIRANDEILVVGYQGSVNLTYPDGGTQRSGVLRVDLIPLWLTDLRIKAVHEDVRPKLRRFKQETAKVLWEAFQEGRLTADMALAVMKLAVTKSSLRPV